MASCRTGCHALRKTAGSPKILFGPGHIGLRLGELGFGNSQSERYLPQFLLDLAGVFRTHADEVLLHFIHIFQALIDKEIVDRPSSFSRTCPTTGALRTL
jgi:hypothetical protein